MKKRSMLSPQDDSLPTRKSLLTRLKDWDDQESWRDFYNTYWKLIYNVARKAGLTDAEAQDVSVRAIIDGGGFLLNEGVDLSL